LIPLFVFPFLALVLALAVCIPGGVVKDGRGSARCVYGAVRGARCVECRVSSARVLDR
jgi:hypothetical protein